MFSCHFVFFLCPIICQFSKNIFLFQKRVQKLGISNFSVLNSFFENSHFLGLLKHHKIGVSADVCALCC